MGREFELYFVPPAVDVGVMAFGFGERADLVDEGEGCFEIFEDKFPRDRLVVGGDGPLVGFGGEFKGGVFVEREGAAFAGDAFLLVERLVHMCG